MAPLRPQAEIVLRAVRNEFRIKQIAKRRAHRFRSWTYQRYRPFFAKAPVVLTADPDAMDGPYLSRCLLKAAYLRKHDSDLWDKYTLRLQKLLPTLSSNDLTIIFYSYGKSQYPYKNIFSFLLPLAIKKLSDFNSQGLMAVTWCMTRMRHQDLSVFLAIAEEAVRRQEEIRAIDFLKIFNCLATMDVPRSPITDKFSILLRNKLDFLSAQNFRYAVHPTAVCNLHSRATQLYILQRFSRIRAILTSIHYRSGYRTAISLRVLRPKVYAALHPTCRTHLTHLSLKRIPWDPQYPSNFHWDVSGALVQLGVYHRNMFLWGCFWIDIGETEDKNQCWMIDAPSSFYTDTLNYTASVKLIHSVLWNLGWTIRRVPWSEWVQLETNDQKINYLRMKRNSIPEPQSLRNIPTSPAKLFSLQQILNEKKLKYKEKNERELRGPPIELHL